MRFLWNFKTFFLFVPRNIFGSVEVHLKTSLWSGRNVWKNFSWPSQPEIQYLNHSFEDLVRKPLVQH